MPATRPCPKCGAEIPANAPSGHCPKCLLGAGLAFADDGAPAPPLDPAQAPEARLRFVGDYELLREIARGGMGVVFQARQISLNRTVAVKMILAGPWASEVDVHRFRVEAETAASLQHPNIVPIHEVGEHDGHPYFSMDYVEGKDLGELVRAGPLPVERAARYVKILAEAIFYAHERGTLHRDLKPSNVLIDQFDQPRITDFGLAKRIERQGELRVESGASLNPQLKSLSTNLTLTGQVLGSPNFMSPEQARGGSSGLGPPSDVYSLGAVLYHLLTARPPFAAATVEATLLQVLHHDPVAPRALNPSVPRDLETICLKCLDKEQARRYSTANALAEELGRYLRGEPILARPASSYERAGKWVRRHPLTAALIAAIVVSVLLGLGGVTWQWQRAEREWEQTQAANARLRLQSAEDHFSSDRAHLALATLARLLRGDPQNRVAAERLLNALSQRVFLLPSSNEAFGPLAAAEPTAGGVGTVTLHYGREGRILSNAHAQVIRSIQFSPDHRRLVSASADSTAKVWDARTGLLQLIVRHVGAIYHAEFSPDGTRLVTASRDKTARLWDATEGLPIGEAMHHQDSVNSARFSPEGGRVVTASDDGTARLWSAFTGQVMSEPARLGRAVEQAYFSTDGGRIAVQVDPGESNQSDFTFVISRGLRLLPTSDADVLLAGAAPSETSNAVWLRWQSKLAGGHAGPITFVALNPEGTRVATASADQSARIWDVHTLRPVTGPLPHDGVVNCARFSPDGFRLVTSTATRKVRMWDAATGLPLSDWILSPERVAAVAFSPDGHWIISNAGWKWKLVHLTGAVAPWLPDLAEAVAGVRFSREEVIEPLPSAAFPDWKARMQSNRETNRITQWAREFAGDEAYPLPR